MNVIRPTPGSALEQTRKLLEDLERWAANADSQARGREAAAEMRGLREFCESPRLEVEVAWFGAERGTATDIEAEDEAGDTGLANCAGTEFRLVAASHERGGSRPVGEVVPPILVIVVGPGADIGADVRTRGLRLAFDRGVVLVSADAGAASLEALMADLSELALVVEDISGPEPLRDRVKAWLRGQGRRFDARMLQSRAAAKAASTTLQACAEAASQSLRGARVRRAVIQQRVAGLSARTTASSVELGADLRARLGALVTGYEARLHERLDALTATSGDSFVTQIDALASSVKELRQQHQVQTTVLTVDEPTSAGLRDTVERHIRPHLRKDIEAAQALLVAGRDVLTSALEQAGAPPFVPQFQHLGEDAVRRVVEPLTTASIPYRGEVHRRGPFEMFMLARRYQMVFYLLLTIFGAGISRGQDHRGAWIALSAVLLAIGLVIMTRTVRRERAYALERELERARDAIKLEGRRLAGELQRAWVPFLARYVRDEMQSMHAQGEAPLRQLQAARATEAADEKQRIQRQIQALETSERRLATLARQREEFAHRLAQFLGHLDQMLTSTREPREAETP